MRTRRLLALGAIALAGCASDQGPPPQRSPEAVQADIRARLPEKLALRAAWAVDLQTVFAALDIEPSARNICAVLAVAEQESTFSADPAVPGLGRIAREEIDRRAERAGIPALAVALALKLDSSDGRSYEDRLAAARTEGELSLLYEDMLGRIPLGRQLFAEMNPVRTGGPMQVSIAFAEALARQRPYPFPGADSVRHEIFTRRGGLYYGTAHLLDYAAPAYGEQMIYRFADFNAGRWASRNAAFQLALAAASGRAVDPDGDLVVAGGVGQTEQAARSLAAQLEMNERAIRRELERGGGPDFDASPLAQRVFALAEKRSGRAWPRAALPRIALHSPKITRQLTTEWFARRVDERWRRCLDRGATP